MTGKANLVPVKYALILSIFNSYEQFVTLLWNSVEEYVIIIIVPESFGRRVLF